MQKQKTNIH